MKSDRPSFFNLTRDLPVPTGKSGDWSVEDFEVTPSESKWSSIRAIMHPDEYVEPGKYKRLLRGGRIVMSNTRFEIRTNMQAFLRARGTVLINGLGLGMLLSAMLNKTEIERVIVIEKSPDVIALVGPSFIRDSRVRIIQDDALTFKPASLCHRINYAWHDIWDNVSADNLESMKQLHRKYGRFTDSQDSWCRAQCEMGY